MTADRFIAKHLRAVEGNSKLFRNSHLKNSKNVSELQISYTDFSISMINAKKLSLPKK